MLKIATLLPLLRARPLSLAPNRSESHTLNLNSWLKKWNPRINWTRLSMTISSSPCSHIPYHARYLGLNADHELFQLFSSLSPAEDDWSLHEYCLQAGGSEEQINKVTILTQLVQAETPKEIPVPNFCTNFTNVFSEKTYNILPPH